jgi:cytoskeletal protein CcmA (bactofilin family)
MTPAEEELFNAIGKKGRVEFAGAGREIGARFLAEQLMCEEDRRPRKLTLREVAVVGLLDLEAGEVKFPVEFERCTFDHAPNFEQATMAGLYLTDCSLPGFCASQLRLQDGLALHGCTVDGCVQLTGANVAGQLDMDDCVIDGPFDGALKADGLRVEQDFFCSGKFRVTGLTHMIGAHIGGQFICEGATFRNPGQELALELSGLVVEEHVFWRAGMSVEGEVNLSGADIAGRLVCRNARFSSPGTTAIRAAGLKVGQDVQFAEKCTVDGELDLVGCRVGGWMRFTGGEFVNPRGKAINLARASTGLNLVLRRGTVVRGQLCLAGAQIGGTLGAQGGEFLNGSGTAIEATGMKVHGDLRLAVRDRVRFHAHGQVVLSDAYVGGNLDCTGGLFENEDGDALVARGIRVGMDATLCAAFTARGRVDFAGARIDGKLDFTGARLKHEGDAVRCDSVRVGHAVTFEGAFVTGCVRMCDARIGSEISFVGSILKGGATALKLKGTQVRGALRLRFAEQPVGMMDLRRVKVGSLADQEGDWSDKTRLDEFVYGALLDESMPLPKRLDWLRVGHAYVPQVYLQLSAVYAKAGLHGAATDVLMAKEDAKRRKLGGFFGRLHRTVWWVLNPTVGYGYRPLRILWCLGVLAAFGGLIFHLLRQDPRNFAPTRIGLDVSWFDPWLYTIDLLLPIMSLNHSQLWVPLHGARWASLAFTVLGWVLAVCLVTGIGRLFKRDER